MSHNSGNARRILLDGVFNCRDLGGYPCAGGKTTQFGRFIRCGIPFGPMGPDRARLAEIPVKTVIDLRGNGESKVAPSAYAKEPDIVYHHYTLLEINPAYVEKVESQPLWESYVCSLTEHKENMAQVFHAIAAAPEGAVLFHCALGKDRTGIVAAMLLSLAEVDRLDIIADYQISNTYLQPMFRTMVEDGNDIFDEEKNPHLKSDPETMEKFCTYLDKTCGGTRAYLESIGVTSEEIDAIIRKLTD